MFDFIENVCDHVIGAPVGLVAGFMNGFVVGGKNMHSDAGIIEFVTLMTISPIVGAAEGTVVGVAKGASKVVDYYPPV